MSEVLRNTLVKLQALIGLIGLAALTPLLILAAILSHLIAKLCRCPKPKSIEGEVAVVTGAGHGLGRAISLELAKKGCHIAAVDINLSGAEHTVKQIQETYNVRAKAYKANVTKLGELVDLNNKVVDDLGPVTVLINNAGVMLHRNILNPDPADVQLMIDVNLTSHFWTKMVFLPPMKALRKGFIVTISSLAGVFPLPYSTAYTTSKAGTMAHMRALRMELALEKQNNIHVTTVLPTFLRTNDEVTQMSNTIGIEEMYPLISGEEVAHRVVGGMLRGEHEITLPDLASVLYRLVFLLPVDWQMRMILLLSGSRFKEFSNMRS
ncbi:estradiol 17-beta-dehydrogenase 11 [Drosophila subpulchrella]|uniref:estradiol 17-beta-dehydrogenase 11 n=1 Tax=Drosophila subpulchrella TaxID=1486046 RepID=UPI0018A14CB4|nr:estradiol 17-beta-dehydrogenase 11 [Drosophila subpulchrella]